MAEARTAGGKFDLAGLHWSREHDLSDPERPVDNSTAILGGDLKAGRVDFITRWKPGHHCSYHRHLGDTISIVLEGEHWIEKEDGSRRMRPPGHYACTPAGEYHREFAGPEGSLVFFSVQSPDGRAFEALDCEGNAIGEISIEQFLQGQMFSSE